MYESIHGDCQRRANRDGLRDGWDGGESRQRPASVRGYGGKHGNAVALHVGGSSDACSADLQSRGELGNVGTAQPWGHSFD